MTVTSASPAISDKPYTLRRGNSALMVSIPHAGTVVPDDILAQMTPQARQLADTDWHLPEVYDFLEALDATVLAGTHSRLVIDLNRPPDDQNLYPGQNTTGLLPVDTFRNEPVYSNGLPDASEAARRLSLYWKPYHECLARELTRLRAVHPKVVLWDAHSIASVLPRFFEGRLTDLNFGSAKGAACDPALVEAVLEPVRRQTDYDWVLDGRFTGGYITRTYGAPATDIHAVQLEMTQVIYMDEQAPFPLIEDKTAGLRPLLRQCLQGALSWAGG